MTVTLIPESAPFDTEQRAWLNGFFAGLLGIPTNGHANGQVNGNATALLEFSPGAAAPTPDQNGHATADDEDFPWHDAALPLDDRLKLADGKPLERRMMAAMAQLDCGACGYLCKTYSEAIVLGEEKNLTLCSPGGAETAKMLKKLIKGENGKPPSANGNGRANGSVAKVPGTASKGYDRKNPFPARLVSSTNLNKDGSIKDTRHVVINLAGSNLTYNVGDSLGVYPTNCPEFVDAIVAAIAASRDEPVIAPSGAESTLRNALLQSCNLRNFDEDLLRLLAESAQGDDVAALNALSENDDEMAKLDVLDLFERFPSSRPDPAALVAALTPLAPRLYSIASSLKANPDQVHLTVAKATVMVDGRLRKGVASTMFAERVSPNDTIPVFVQASHGFSLPSDPTVPIIMVGPGTGVAPFRAFLQERQTMSAAGKSWLFFGDQRRATDFLYESEFQSYLDSGILTRLAAAFSRDQEHKVYVQNLMHENDAELFGWLEQGAYFYVCGDAKRMARDVDQALHEIVARHGQRTPESAAAYVADLTKSKRYLRDVY